MDQMNITQVTAAIIRQDDKVLICQRAQGESCSNLWEFPGGKLEVCETLEECLIRECKEELGISIRVKDIFARTSHKDGDKEMGFTFFHAEIMDGELKMKVHQDVRWVTSQELGSYTFCPADVEIAERLMGWRKE